MIGAESDETDLFFERVEQESATEETINRIQNSFTVSLVTKWDFNVMRYRFVPVDESPLSIKSTNFLTDPSGNYKSTSITQFFYKSFFKTVSK